jgi:hypothetical protein
MSGGKNSGIEVAGASAFAIVDAFRSFSLIAGQLLESEKIGHLGADGKVVFDTTKWYPLDAILRVFQKIKTSMGDASLFQVGKAIPKTAAFPPSVNDIESALKLLNMAYHMNHRKDGQVMMSADGQMLSGIGSYDFVSLGIRQARLTCSNPYPCSFDKGIITAVAHKMAKTASVEHENPNACRSNAASSCSYVIKW